ncbi:MAG: glycine--tRNA ligase subunit beta, partial [SAR202 cluster bacterium]|nr:glycine--tRNA ligase subunit beta [SAR202 cluster bacterium]
MVRWRLGNERVLTFRFNDAAHHAREDEKRTLEQFREELKRIVFLEKLGSVWDRSNRLERWMAGCDAWAGDAAGQERGRRAARLCKADLASHMVAELPELQGVMGALYALRDGEDPAVAEAIENHYRPRAAGDPIPETHGARLLALADRLDLLVAAFSLGFLPTGSSDPFGLRRAAAGVVALLQELPTELELPALLALSYRTF